MDVSPDVFPDAVVGTSPSLPPLLRMADMTADSPRYPCCKHCREEELGCDWNDRHHAPCPCIPHGEDCPCESCYTARGDIA